MAEIADSAGVTKPVLYQHFASKRDLYSTVLRDIGDRLLSSVIGAASAADTPRQQVDAGFRAYVAFAEHDRDGFQLLFCGNSRQDDEWGAITREVESSIAQSVADLIDVSEMSAGHRQALAHGIMGLAEAMMRYWQSGIHPDLERDELIESLSALAWGGLRGLEA